MLKWLKRKLKAWLLESDEEPWLDCVGWAEGKSETIRYHVTGAVGLKLLGQADRSIRLIGEEDVLDQERFWRLFKRFSKADIRWEDGTKFKPGR